jgi:hypothetical protein
MNFEAIGDRQPEQDAHSLWDSRSFRQSDVKNNELDYGDEESSYSTDKNNIPREVKKLLVRRAVKKKRSSKRSGRFRHIRLIKEWA